MPDGAVDCVVVPSPAVVVSVVVGDVPVAVGAVPVSSWCDDASTSPTRMVAPRGRPRWSASRWIDIADTDPCQDWTKLLPPPVDSPRTSSVPQPARSKWRPGLGEDTDWPSTIRFVMSEAERSPVPPFALADAVSELAVISPPKIDRSLILTTPDAVPAFASASTVDVAEAAPTTEPSAGYPNPAGPIDAAGGASSWVVPPRTAPFASVTRNASACATTGVPGAGGVAAGEVVVVAGGVVAAAPPPRTSAAQASAQTAVIRAATDAHYGQSRRSRPRSARLPGSY